MSRRMSCPTLVGRGQELAVLEDALARAAAGGAGTVLVGGDAGIGKTRLVTEVAAHARGQEWRVLTGGCLDLGEGVPPYAPLLEALRGLPRELGRDETAALLGGERSELAALLPDLRQPGATPTPSGSFQRGRVAELVLALLERLGATAPTLLVLEDLHWADAATRELVAFLARNLTRGRVLLAGTYRSDELHRRHPLWPLLVELGRSGHIELIELRPMERGELAEQLAGILGVPPSATVIDAVFARCGGNPFFAEELVAAGPVTGELPASIREVLLIRVERLPAAARQVLRVVATAGGRASHGLLAAVASTASLTGPASDRPAPDRPALDGRTADAALDGPALDAALREAVTRRLLVVDTQGDAYAFRHALLGEAVAADLLPGERRRLHAAVARALQDTPGADPAALAHHWHTAGEPARSLPAWVAAGTAAGAAHAPALALAHYERALLAWDQVADPATLAGTDHVSLLRRAAEMANMAGEYVRATQLLETTLGEAAADPAATGALLERLARSRWLAGDVPGALATYQEAVRRLDGEPPSAQRALVLAGNSQILMLLSRDEAALAPCQQALTMARSVGARDVEGHVLNTLGVILVNLGDREEGLRRLRESQAIARTLPDPAELCRTYVNLSESLLRAGGFGEAAAVGQEGMETAARLGLARAHGAATAANLISALVRLGRWDEAEAASRRVAELGSLPVPWPAVPMALARATLALRRGRLDQAAELLGAATRLLSDTKEAQSAGQLASAKAQLALWRGRHDHAREAVAGGLELLAASGGEYEPTGPELCALGTRVEADWVEAAAVGGRAAAHAEAARRADGLNAKVGRLLAVYTRRGTEPPPPATVFALECAAERSRLGPPDPAAWDVVAARWEELGDPYSHAYARFRHVEALLAAHGPRRTAAARLRDAARTAARLGASLLEPEIHALATRARIDLTPPDGPAPAAPDPPDSAAPDLGLTDREREVLSLLTVGMTNRQIAERLFISDKTASVHVSSILRKLGVTSRIQAGAIAQHLGLRAD